MNRVKPVLSAVVGRWLDQPPEETLHTAALAAELGFGELWIGETATYDAFALATAIGLATERIRLTIGPLAVDVRDPAMIAMGAASVASLTRHRVRVALGTSSTTVVRDWHGRMRSAGADTLANSARTVTRLLAGEQVTPTGETAGDAGFKLRVDPPGGAVTVAAFGPRTVRAAAEHADRMVLNMVSATTAVRLRAELDAAAERAGRPAPKLAVWLPTTVDPTPESLAQLVRDLVPYLAAPGYREMFTESGYGEVVELACTGAGQRAVLEALPLSIVGTIGLVGGRDTVLDRIGAYAEAGVDEIAVVPATAGDRGGERTLRAVRELAAG